MNKKVTLVIIFVVVITLAAAIAYQQDIFKPQEKKKTYCTLESRTVDGCTAQYDPVCGWFDTNRVQCIDYPCASTAGNACEACKNADIEYWTQGACPLS